MKINYKIECQLNNEWEEVGNFQRDLFDDSPLDETLDTGVIVEVPSGLAIIPPYTLCRITSSDASNGEILSTDYMLTSDIETEAVTLFTGN